MRVDVEDMTWMDGVVRVAIFLQKEPLCALSIRHLWWQLEACHLRPTCPGSAPFAQQLVSLRRAIT